MYVTYLERAWVRTIKPQIQLSNKHLSSTRNCSMPSDGADTWIGGKALMTENPGPAKMSQLDEKLHVGTCDTVECKAL